jgi:predicted phosphodiesterase
MRCAFVTDEHHPYQDEHARSVALQIVREFKPEQIIVGSDGVDFYNLSRFDKNPDRIKEGLQKEIDSWKRGVKEWKCASPRAKLRWIRGNHEDRLRQYMWQHPELYTVTALKLENLLGLPELGITDNGEEIVYNNLVVRHGTKVRPLSGASVRSEIEKERFAFSILMGHVHRGGSVFYTIRDRVIQGQEGFCLCKTDPEYAPFPDWQQGIVLFDVDANGVTFEPVHITSFRHRKRAVWRGKEYLS